MLIKAVTYFVLALLFACSSAVPVNKQTPPELASLFNQYWEEHNKFFPLDATQQGDNRFNNLLPNDQTEEFRSELRRFYDGYLTKIKTFKREDLNPDDQISYDIFTYEMKMQAKGLNDDSYMIPFHQFWGLPLTLGQMGSGESFQPFKTVEDYENWLGRVKGFSAWTDSAIANFRRGLKTGFVLPKMLVQRMIPEMSRMVVRDPKRSLFYGPITKLPAEFGPEEKKRLTTLYTDAIQKELVPSYKKLRDFLTREYLPRARRSSGLNALKTGPQIYSHLVKYWTTTDMDPKTIHEIGLTEVKRIRAEMESVSAKAGFPTRKK